RDLEPGHAAGPGDEALRPVELVELVPEDQAGLLEQVVGVVEVAHERVDVTKELGLVPAQPGGELGPGVSHRVHRTRHPRPGRTGSPNGQVSTGAQPAGAPAAGPPYVSAGPAFL